ncbi:MAG: sterol desaturase family protein [Melioribacteraceae bacterium]|nr:sterol desaturase family protein [Melioribacteraceae bacterium]MCF8354557.1 sterol desaturase family protein [Melioribacteraceae bacterium]MCF8394489.1 sterol desaturase family protein [Melioribacteraceae bacterium]MCF8420101.1 sterol desaturase family protein [Melioribacteraceae bacterium]
MAKNYISNSDETVRMFENDILEFISKVHWSVPLWIFIPIISYMTYISFAEFSVSISNYFLLLAGGLVIWTLTEYVLHRFVFHFEFKSKFGKKIHFMFHGVHHDYPNDSRRLVMPPSVSLPLASMFYFFYLWLLGPENVYPFFSGFLIGYLFYDITHYAIHHYNMKSRFWLFIKKHHMLHHYKDANKGFGVSQPTWDHVFGTTFTEKE